MARTIPAVATIALPDTRLTTPTKPVDAGSAANLGHWRDVAQVHNLNIAMVHAQPVYQQMWDGGFVYNVPGWTFRYKVAVPKLTDQHTNITCRVYGYSPGGAGGGKVRFSAAFAPAVFSVVTLPAGPAVWTAAATFLAVGAGAFAAGDTELVTVETEANVNIAAIALEYNQINPGGAYPAAADALAAGVGPDGAIPLDLLEVGADSPLCSEIAQTLSGGVTAVSARLRTYHAMGVLDGSFLLERPFRVIVPVYDLGAVRHPLKFRLLATGQAQAQRHLIQHNPSTTEAAHDAWKDGAGARAPRGFTAVDIPAGAAVPFDSGEVGITLLAGDIIQAPGGYFGFAHLTVYPVAGFNGFAAWGI